MMTGKKSKSMEHLVRPRNQTILRILKDTQSDKLRVGWVKLLRIIFLAKS